MNPASGRRGRHHDRTGRLEEAEDRNCLNKALEDVVGTETATDVGW